MATVIDLDDYREKKRKQRGHRPRVVRMLKLALEFQRQLDAGEVACRADLARNRGITRARVTQLLNLLQLAPDLQKALLDLPVGTPNRLVSEHGLRGICGLDHAAQRTALDERLRTRQAGPSRRAATP